MGDCENKPLHSRAERLHASADAMNLSHLSSLPPVRFTRNARRSGVPMQSGAAVLGGKSGRIFEIASCMCGIVGSAGRIVGSVCREVGSGRGIVGSGCGIVGLVFQIVGSGRGKVGSGCRILGSERGKVGSECGKVDQVFEILSQASFAKRSFSTGNNCRVPQMFHKRPFSLQKAKQN